MAEAAAQLDQNAIPLDAEQYTDGHMFVPELDVSAGNHPHRRHKDPDSKNPGRKSAAQEIAGLAFRMNTEGEAFTPRSYMAGAPDGTPPSLAQKFEQNHISVARTVQERFKALDIADKSEYIAHVSKEIKDIIRELRKSQTFTKREHPSL